MTLITRITEMATQAVYIIQKETATFVAEQKTGYDGVEDDLVTTADFAAQRYYQTEIERDFPDDGILGEEDLKKESVNGRRFTIDPLDGTKAFGRKQSTGVGTMIAHVDECGVVDAACVGDVNTGELYYYGPGVVPTRRRFGVETPLPKLDKRPTEETYVILREHPEKYPPVIQDLVRTKDYLLRIRESNMFKDIYVESGSIGITLAKLWKGEVGMVILNPGFNTPWDTTPIIGMNKMLGIVHIAVDPETMEMNVFDPALPKDVEKKEYVEIMVREQHVKEILQYNWRWCMGEIITTSPLIYPPSTWTIKKKDS